MPSQKDQKKYLLKDAGAVLDNLPGVVCQFKVTPEGDFHILHLGGALLKKLTNSSCVQNMDPAMLLEQIPEAERLAFISTVIESSQDLAPYEAQHSLTCPDGGVRRFQVSARPEKGSDGSTIWQALALEIAEPKETGQYLRKERDVLQAFISQAADAIYISDLSGNLIQVNRRACQESGYSQAELLKMNIADLDLQQNDPKKVTDFFRGLKPNSPVTLNSSHKRKNGGSFPAEITVTMIDTSAGPRVLGIARDVTHHKLAEDALIQSEERYSALFDGLEALVCLYDYQGNCLMVNRKASHWMCSPTHELINKNLTDLRPDNFELYLKNIRKTIDTGEVITFENRVNFPQKPRWLLSTVHPVKNAAGEIYAAQVISHDISDRRQMEEALKESEERFSLFTKHLPGLIFIKDHESRYLFVNQKLADFFGIPASELVGRTSQEVFSGEQAQRYVDTDRQLMETGEPIVIREDFKGPEGETIIMLNHKFLISRPGRPPLIAGFYLDMTDRFRTEEELAATQDLLETAIAQSPSGIIIADAPHGKVRLINQAAMNIKTGDNASRGESEPAKHTHEWDAYYPGGNPYPEELLPHNRAVRHGETVRNEEFKIKNLAGEMRWVSANAAPIYNKNNEIEASIIILHDISEQKKLEQARWESEERFRAFFHSGPMRRSPLFQKGPNRC